ncbi:MAG: M56 family metallopeptidase [Gammaproteobacteria bacterium]|nr:M56 family metallopeptidase [Gammaproteobacteria bacterium]
MTSLFIGTMLRSLLLGIAVALALAILRVRNPHLQKSAWTAVLASALVTPALMPILARAHGPVIPAPSYLLTVVPVAVGPPASGPMRPSLAAVYGVVVLLLLARYASSLIRLARIRRKARCVVEQWAADLDVRVTAELSGPATFGGTILLPEEHVHWSAHKRDAIMAHERSHVRAHDCQRLWLAKLYTCLFWINPLGWWLERRIAALAEETSDAAALLVVGNAPAYAEILLEFAAVGERPALATGMGCPSIAARIERIIGGKALADEPLMWRRCVAAAGVVPAMFLLATLQLAAAPGTFAQERTGTGEPARAHADAPHILSWPTARQLIRFYPPKAEREGTNGLVTLAVTLDDKGQATDTEVLAEEPRDFGFGSAASAVVHVMKYSNPTGRSAQLEFRIKFALHHEHSLAKPPR